jgi:hypothetical protein
MVAVTLLASLPACAPKPSVRAAWPRADRERTVEATPQRPTWPFTGVAASLEGSDVPPPILVPLPQGPLPAALAMADVVFELPSATGTRLAALFQSDVPVGPVPVAEAFSAEVSLAVAYRARLAHAGDLDMVPPSGLDDVGPRAVPDAYPAGKAAVDLEVLATTQTPVSGETSSAFAFSDAPPAPAAGSVVSTLTVPYAKGAEVQWRWEPATKTYRRAFKGNVQDAGGKELRAANVVLLWARPSREDSSGVELRVGGRASVFHGGRKFIGTWRIGEDGRPELRDERGGPLQLTPGVSWVELVPNELDIVVQ